MKLKKAKKIRRKRVNKTIKGTKKQLRHKKKQLKNKFGTLFGPPDSPAAGPFGHLPAPATGGGVFSAVPEAGPLGHLPAPAAPAIVYNLGPGELPLPKYTPEPVPWTLTVPNKHTRK